MVNEYKDLKKNKNHVLFFITSLIVVFVGLTLIIKPLMKSDKERMQKHFTEDVVKGMVQDAFSKYIDLKIKNIFIDYDAIEGANSILAYGDATSKQYGGKKFSYRIEFAIDDDATTKKGVNYGIVEHYGVGIIVDLNGLYSVEPVYIDSESFKKKLVAYNSEQRAINEEYKNAVQLAYQNKTKVHFGMSEAEFKKCASGFKRNFVDGLIGKGAFNDETDFDIVKGKLVGFKVKNGKHQHLDYTNVDKIAKCTKSDTRYVGRWYVNEYNYVCNLYNLNIHKSQTSNGDYGYDYYETINVYWNSYLRRYD